MSDIGTPSPPAASTPKTPRPPVGSSADATPMRVRSTAAVTAANAGGALSYPPHSPNKSTGRGTFSFSIGPAHSRIDDFSEWYSQLTYDPKQPTAAQRHAIRKAEAETIAVARSRMTRADTQRHLLQLSSALRADLEVFVNHLLDCGAGANPSSTSLVTGPADDLTPAQAASLEAAALSKESFLQLKTLFDILDIDRSGTLTYDELQRASIILGRERYDKANFRALDRDRSGSIDFLEMLKVFFPRLTLRYITKCHREFIKYADSMKSVRDRLLPEYVAQMDAQYARLSAMPGGCTVDNMLTSMSTYMNRNRHIVEETFKTFDSDGDGCLSLEEFCEMTKFSYPPYAREPPETSRGEASSKPGASTPRSKGHGSSNDHSHQRHGASKKPAHPLLATAGTASFDLTQSHQTFSLETLARRRLIDPKQIRLPHIPVAEVEEPHVLHPSIMGLTNTRQGHCRNKLERVMGKSVIEKHEARVEAKLKRKHQSPTK